MKKYISLFFLILFVAGCGGSDVDKAAFRMLGDARFALRHGHYDEARDTIFSMRRQYPTAIEARKQGILLLDSIELTAAKDSLQHAQGQEWERLHVKAQFFERKLQEDKKKN